jgi:UV DNA damage endonuclease
LARLGDLCRTNAASLLDAVTYCRDNEIGCFRVNSQILPLKTHPEIGYGVDELPSAEEIIRDFRRCGEFARAYDIRLTFHPDQFVVLNSPRPEVVDNSIRELEYQAEVAAWIGADVINIHGGGAYGDKSVALDRLRRNLSRLSDNVRSRLTLENDDKIYTPRDLLPLCRSENIPLVYDIHHHRCLDDELDERETTGLAAATWNREPLFHISSPRDGWKSPHPERHHDFINLRDFPTFWEDMDITVEVEAKAKEIAIARLQKGLENRRRRRERVA